jgi:hypothetical protein
MLEILTRRFMGEEAFKRIYRNKGDFKIDWDKFYTEVTSNLLTDGYNRYRDSFSGVVNPNFQTSTVITHPETGLSSLKRLRENFGIGGDNVDDDEKDRLSKLPEPKKCECHIFIPFPSNAAAEFPSLLAVDVNT